MISTIESVFQTATASGAASVNVFTRNIASIWPHGVVPYSVKDTKWATEKNRQLLEYALRLFSENVNECITFREKTSMQGVIGLKIEACVVQG